MPNVAQVEVSFKVGPLTRRRVLRRVRATAAAVGVGLTVREEPCGFLSTLVYLEVEGAPQKILMFAESLTP